MTWTWRRHAGLQALTTGGVLMLEWLRFSWSATRGFRLRPWRSPYLLWRVETYTGRKAETVRFASLVHLVWVERFQMLRFFRWLHAMRDYRQSRP